MKHGLATWAEFPYDSNYRAWCLNPATWRNALSARANQSGRVADVDTDTGLAQVKQLLVNGYVLNFATYISSWNWKTIANDPATTADDAFAGKQCAYIVNGATGGHAMTIVGYNDDIWVDINGDGLVTPNEKGALRIANSWGTGWGEAGFCWLAYDAIRTRNSASTSEGIFWSDEVTWVTARPGYVPQFIMEFTLSHLKRNQLLTTLGISTTASSSPTTTWSPNRVLSYAGGPYAFDGSTTAIDGSFCLDLTDLTTGATGIRRLYLGMRDSTVSDIATLKGLTLIDLVHGVSVTCSQVPQTADGNLVYASIDYDLTNGGTPSGDFTPPTVQITSPAVGSTVSGTVNIGITSSDTVGVSQVECYIDGALRTSGASSSLSYTWDTTATSNGPHTIEARAYDAAQNSSSVTTSVTVNNPDTIAPVVQITSPTSGSSLSAKTVKVSVSASDNVAVTRVQIYVDGVLLGTDTATPYTFNWNTGKVAKGLHTLIATAADAAGHEVTSAAVSVTLK